MRGNRNSNKEKRVENLFWLVRGQAFQAHSNLCGISGLVFRLSELFL